MAGTSIKDTEAAREVAAWLGSNGQTVRGRTVRRLCDSHAGQRALIGGLLAETASLRARLTPIARARRRPNPLRLELELLTGRLEAIREAYEQHGGDAAIHIDDPEQVIDLLHRVAAALR